MSGPIIPQLARGLPRVPEWSLRAMGQLNARETTLMQARNALVSVLRAESVYRCLSEGEGAALQAEVDALLALLDKVRERRALIYTHRLEAEPPQ